MLSILSATLLVVGALAAVPNVPLYNAAQAGMTMPALGLGTGGYGSTKGSYGEYPECWMELAGCGPYTIQAVETWLNVGGLRLDCADSYDTQTSVGLAMSASGVPRENIFVLQKTGSWNRMGFEDTLSQFAVILSQMNTTYVDLLVNHWPTSTASPTVDKTCYPDLPSYNAKQCRLNTWRAMVELYQNGTAKSIGVANYNASHIQEIIDAGMPLPSVNQVPYHLYNAQSQQDILKFCRSLNITLLSYSPFGIPDWHSYPVGPGELPSNTTLTDPVVLQVAAAHPGTTPAQIILAWLWGQGIPSNPRSMNKAHMLDNMNAFDIVLTPAEMQALSTRPQDLCSFDGSFYECVEPSGQVRSRGPALMPQRQH